MKDLPKFHLHGLKKSSVPLALVVVVNEGELYPAQQKTTVRQQDESEGAFWRRTITEADAMSTGKAYCFGQIICKYHSITLEQAHGRDKVFNLTNLHWHIADHSKDGNLRVKALCVLADLYFQVQKIRQ